MPINELLDKILEGMPNVEFGYLFGSYADGSFNDRSDVDVAIYFKEYDFDEHLTLISEISKITNKDTDLTILNKVKNLYLLEDIISKGIILKDSDKRIDFELLKHHQFIDFIDFKKRIYAA